MVLPQTSDGGGGSIVEDQHADGTADDLAAVPGLCGTVGFQGDETKLDSRHRGSNDTGDDDDTDDDDDDRLGGRGRIEFPEGKLYGREEEIAEMRRAYEEVASASAAVRDFALERDVFSSMELVQPQRLGGVGDSDCSGVASFVVVSENNGGDGGECGDGDGGQSRLVGGSVRAIFLGGEAGTGKSSMVREMLRRIEDDASRESARTPGTSCLGRPIFAAGKFRSAASDPFSAVAEAFASLASTIVEEAESKASGPSSDLDGESAMGLGMIRERMDRAGLAIVDPPGAALLRSFPDVAPLLTANYQSPAEDGSSAGGASISETSVSLATGGVTTCSNNVMSALMSCRPQDTPHFVRSAARLFLSALFGGQEDGCKRPLILFLDDLQWADEASIALVASILARGGPEELRAPLRHILFVGAYRDNEVGEGHPLRSVIAESERSLGSGAVCHMKLGCMSRSDVRNFVGDCVDKPPYEVLTLADAVYDRTMGNAFFVRQAMEELVRRNVLYYDVVFFEWRWNVDDNDAALEMGENLRFGVREILRSKILDLPELLTKALILAACTNYTFDAETVLALLEAENPGGTTAGASIDIAEILSLLNLAVEEGLLLRHNHRQNRRTARRHRCHRYAFAATPLHDAALSLSDDEGYMGLEEQDLLRLRIATTLLSLHAAVEAAAVSPGEDGLSPSEPEDWMLFVAAEKMNAIARDSNAAPPAEDLARLNLRVAELSRFKAAFGRALELLRLGIACLGGGDMCWIGPNYGLALDLHNLLLRIEFAKGNYAAAEEAAERVVARARRPEDMYAAHLTLVQVISQGSERDYGLATRKAVEVLRMHGHRFPQRPSKASVMWENALLKVELRGRPMRTLADMPHAKEEGEALMMLLDEAATLAVFAENQHLALMFALRAMRISLVKGVSKYLASLVIILGFPYRKEGKFRKAIQRGKLASELLDREANERGLEYLHAKYMITHTLLQLQQPFRDSLDAYAEVYTILISHGSTDIALTVPMNWMFCCFAEGFILDSSFETKLSKSEIQSRALGRPNMVYIFQLSRQFLLNLQGKGSMPPTVLKGKAFNDRKVLETLEGNSRKLMLRDIYTFRLQLAVIFGDLEAMESALDGLVSFPTFDRLIMRQHLRLSFVGLASFILGRRNKKKDRINMGQKILRRFEKLNSIGSASAHPVYWCLVAAKIPGRENYDKAIQACSSSKVHHLEALMMEHCGLFLKDQNDHDTAAEYLERSLGLYTDWGAFAKANQLRDQHDFLRKVRFPGGSGARINSAQAFSITPIN